MRRVNRAIMPQYNDEALTVWGELVMAYPLLGRELPEEVAARIEAAEERDLYQIVAEHLGIDRLGNLHLEAAALALRDASKYAGTEAFSPSSYRLSAEQIRERDHAVYVARKWAAETARLAMAAVDQRRQDGETSSEDVRARTQAELDTLHSWIYGEGEGPRLYTEATDYRAFEGPGILNSMSILCLEFLRTAEHHGLILDSSAQIGPLTSTSNVVASTRDLYRQVIDANAQLAARWEMERRDA